MFYHVEQFIKTNNKSLGKYSEHEQCGEAIHAKFKPIWARFKRDNKNPDHGENLNQQ